MTNVHFSDCSQISTTTLQTRCVLRMRNLARSFLRLNFAIYLFCCIRIYFRPVIIIQIKKSQKMCKYIAYIQESAFQSPTKGWTLWQRILYQVCALPFFYKPTCRDTGCICSLISNRHTLISTSSSCKRRPAALLSSHANLHFAQHVYHRFLHFAFPDESYEFEAWKRPEKMQYLKVSKSNFCFLSFTKPSFFLACHNGFALASKTIWKISHKLIL